MSRKLTPYQLTLTYEYAPQMRPLLPLAKRAFGARDTVSPAHEASREYTRLLVEFTEKGGSLLHLAKELGVQYSGMRRRVMASPLPDLTRGAPSRTISEDVYDEAVAIIQAAKDRTPKDYHLALKKAYDEGLSLYRIAQRLGMSSANPLYFGVNRVRLNEGEVR
jgi:hypothetical protein